MEQTQSTSIERPSSTWRLAVVVVLSLVAFWMRTYQINEVPPGLMHSELLQLRAADQVRQGEWRMFYNPGYRNEPMYAPILSASQAIFGANSLGRRFPSIFAGMLGLCLVYGLAMRTLGWRIALIALGASAVVWWSIVMQRFILRQVFVMPLFALCLYAFWRGYEEVARANRAGWRYFIIGGVALGVAQYDHTIPRGLFAVFVLFGLYLVLFHRSLFKRLWRGILVLIIVAEVLAAPLLIYAGLHPEENAMPSVDLFENNGIVAFISRLPATLTKVVGQYFWSGEGDDAMEYDIPFRPIFEPVGAVLLAIGMLVALWRLRQPVYAFLLIAWAVVLSSSVLFNADILFSRLVSSQTTTYIFLGLGVETVNSGLRRILSDRVRLVVVTGGLIGLFVVYWVVTAQDMFVVWPSLNGAKWGYNTDLRDLGRYLAAQTQPLPPIAGCTIMNRPEYHDSVQQLGEPFLIPRSDVKIEWHDCRYSLVIPAGGQYLYVHPELEPLSQYLSRAIKSPWLDAQYKQPVGNLNNVLSVDVRSILPAKLAEWKNSPVTWPPEATVTASAQLPINFGQSLELIGYVLPSSAKPGANLIVITYWRVVGPVADDLILFTHVYRTPTEVMAQQDQFDVIGSRLQPGDLVVQMHEFVTVPAGTSPGTYWVGVGAYRKDIGERLPIVVDNQSVADRLFLAQVTVKP